MSTDGVADSAPHLRDCVLRPLRQLDALLLQLRQDLIAGPIYLMQVPRYRVHDHRNGETYVVITLLFPLIVDFATPTCNILTATALPCHPCRLLG